MFARLRLVGRRPKDAARAAASGSNALGRGESAGSAAQLRDKGLVAYALAHAPAWTNELSTTGVRERAANARLRATPPPTIPLDVRVMPHPAPSRGAPSAKGGMKWPTSAAPR